MAYAPVALQILETLAQSAQSEAVRARAAIDLLDRAGLKVADELVIVPQESTNAALDAAIATALAQRDQVPSTVPPFTRETEPPSDPEYPEARELTLPAMNDKG